MGVSFGGLPHMGTGGRECQSMGLPSEGGGRQSGHVVAQDQGRGAYCLQGLLPQLVEGSRTHLAASIMAPRHLELVEDEGCVARVLQRKHTEGVGGFNLTWSHSEKNMVYYVISPYQRDWGVSWVLFIFSRRARQWLSVWSLPEAALCDLSSTSLPVCPNHIHILPLRNSVCLD